MATQWNISVGMAGGHYQGLRYEVLDAVERRMATFADDPPPPDPALLFWQIQQRERSALQYLNKKE